MKLRQWQAECISKAYAQFLAGNTHFLCLATPGAGKTMMASQLANKLFNENLIDLVICLSPSLIVSSDFKEELEAQTGKRIDGKMGSSGCSLTYQSMMSLNEDFWNLLTQYRVFVIFDEIHHCAGHNEQNANSWGERIISEIQGKASFTLALTGTPWRTDNIPIALARYCENQQIHCDYKYGLSKAISDRVCRTPILTLIDNNQIVLNQGHDSSSFKSFKDLFEQTECNYQSVIESESLILYMIDKANQKLNQLRKVTPDAGGLIVATSVVHARKIHQLLETHFNESPDIATYQEEDAVSVIQKYKHSTKKWIISVGMISEGTNLPRLSVCCHLTRVKTELYFRQVLGRILRVNGNSAGMGFLYMPAEPTLTEFAYRVSEDVPKSHIINYDHMPNTSSSGYTEKYMELEGEFQLSIGAPSTQDVEPTGTLNEDSILSRSYEASLNIFGKFNSKALLFN